MHCVCTQHTTFLNVQPWLRASDLPEANLIGTLLRPFLLLPRPLQHIYTAIYIILHFGDLAAASPPVSGFLTPCFEGRQ